MIPMLKTTSLGGGFKGFRFKFRRSTPDYGAIVLYVAGQIVICLVVEEIHHRRQLRLQNSQVLSLDDGEALAADDPVHHHRQQRSSA